jgi:hypothetical protein
MNNFKNTILVVAFNYSHCVNNKEYLKQLYSPYFKEIIFYSDLPEINDDSEINYVDINKGYKLHNIFSHFYAKYKDLLLDSDGLFYTMDDNIINVNMLQSYSTSKIIYYYNKLQPLNAYSRWWWDREWGKKAIMELLTDVGFVSKYNHTEFSGAFSDFFYLPKAYLTDNLFELFNYYAKYNVFLEIAIPSIINNIEKDSNNYSKFNECVLWDAERNLLFDDNYLYKQLKTKFIVHPVKLNQKHSFKDIINKAMDVKKCIVITTINDPTPQILHYSKLKGWDLIIVSDIKTNTDAYKSINCIYLGLKEQQDLFPTIFDKIPLKSYTRKMFGYLYAIKNKYDVIYDTDDDNKYIYDIDAPLARHTKISPDPGFVNIYKLFTDGNIWPRGIPYSHPSVATTPSVEDNSSPLVTSVIQGLVNNDPDVDAYYRLNVNDSSFTFEKETNYDIILDKYSVCPFNTQNTFWIDKTMHYAMYLPVSVSFRYTDILRGFVALYQLWKNNKTIKFTNPTAIQERNPHDLNKDYELEVCMYNTAEQVINLLNSNKNASIEEVYDILYKNNIVQQEEFDTLNEWMRLVKIFS